MTLGADSLPVGFKAGGDVLDQFQLDLHCEVELPKDLGLPPHLDGSRFGVENVLDCARLEPFDSLKVQPDTLQVVPGVDSNDQVIELLDLAVLVPEVRSRDFGSWGTEWHIQ